MSLALNFSRKLIFGISPEKTSFTKRGFREGEPDMQRRLERIGNVFLVGYNLALEEDGPKALALRLYKVEPELSGFAFEGAAMALCLLDHFSIWKRDRLKTFLEGPAASHIYMVHVGVGWALARSFREPTRFLAALDPLLCWLAIDGYGFHEGFFHWHRYVLRQSSLKRLSGYALRVFDQGLGRSLWFIEGADIARIPKTISTFHPSRHADLWSGVGLACAYAGCVSYQSLQALRRAAGFFKPQLAQGAAFAAKARQRAGNPATHTEQACRVFCGLTAEEASNITDAALKALEPGSTVPAYEVWRQRIQSSFADLKD